MRNILIMAMHSPEDYVVSLEYLDSKGAVTRRIVSPIRFLTGGRFLGLCLCREEPRQFYMDRCRNVKLCRASDFVMPVPVTVIAPMPMAATAIPIGDVVSSL